MARALIEGIHHADLINFFGNRSYGGAGLAEGTNAHTLKTTYPVGFEVAGQAYHKAATDNIAMTACAEQADLTSCLYLVTVAAGGTVTTTKGTEALTTAVAAGTATLTLPEAPDGEAVLGAFKVVNSGAVFVSGTTDLGAGTVTDTYASFGYYPKDGSVEGFTFA
jgi:hypothetical protein